MPSMTWRGFCALAPESRNTRPGLRSKIGNSRRSKRGSNPPILLLQIAEPPGEAAQQVHARGEIVDRLDHLAQKTIDQHMARFLGRDAARLQIKKRDLVEVADAGAMTALDVVGIDFELGLSVNRGAGADQQIAAQLVRVGLLSVFADDDAALKRAMPAPRRDAFDQLAGLPARNAMVDRGDDVRFVAAADDKGAVEPAARILACHRDARLMPHGPPAEQEGKARKVW